jgi:hypothetical protein
MGAVELVEARRLLVKTVRAVADAGLSAVLAVECQDVLGFIAAGER